MAPKESSGEVLELRETQRTGPSSTEIDRDGVSETEHLRRETYLKLISAAFSFFVAGVNDGSIGALIPYMLQSYRISTAKVALIYVVTFFGWASATVTNSFLCQIFNLGSMLILGAALQIAGHALRTWLPPFPLFAVTFWLVSLGQAYQDTHANTFVASVKAAHRWLGFIHASYAAGLLAGPFIATAVASAGSPPRWNLFYTCPFGLGVVNLILVAFAFRDTLRLLRNDRSQTQVGEANEGPDVQPTSSRTQDAWKEIKDTLRLPSVWFLCLFFFCYLGAAITAGGWVVEYLVTIRGGDLSQMGYVPAGFNGGTFLGRLLLAEPTHRFGERLMLSLYCLLCVVLQLVFWLVPDIIAASVALSFLGFFLGPFFAAGVSVASRIFPQRIRSSGLSFVFVLGQAGGSLFPAITGIVAARAGVQVLQPILVGLLVATGISWLLVPITKVLHED